MPGEKQADDSQIRRGVVGRSGVRRGRDSEEDLAPSLIRKRGGRDMVPVSSTRECWMSILGAQRRRGDDGGVTGRRGAHTDPSTRAEMVKSLASFVRFVKMQLGKCLTRNRTGWGAKTRRLYTTRRGYRRDGLASGANPGLACDFGRVVSGPG